MTSFVAEEIPSAIRLPAEWETHAATLLAWPVNSRTWPGIFERIPQAFAAFAAAIARFEDVHILATDAVQQTAVPLMDQACENAAASYSVTWHDIPVNDSWCRDYGPLVIFDEHQQRSAVNFRFNAWGQKYEPYTADDCASSTLCQRLSLPLQTVNWVLEGGAIDSNGKGTLLVTDSCLLNDNRNGKVSRETCERMLNRHLGASTVIWLSGQGIVGDDTDGHIDQVARFVARDTTVIAVAADCCVEEATALSNQLETLTDLGLEVRPLQLPNPCFQQGRRIPASYCNFVFTNGGLLVPTFRQTNADTAALETLQNCFPNREIVPVDSLDLSWGLGSLHCLSMQLPGPLF